MAARLPTEEGVGGFCVVVVVIPSPLDDIDGFVAAALFSDDLLCEEVSTCSISPELHRVRMG